MTAALDNTPKTNDDLYQLARDLAEGKAFCDKHVAKADEMLIPRIFLPMAAMTEQERAAFLAAPPPGCIYQYRGVDETAIRIRGYPVFTSYRTLTVDEWNRMVVMIQQRHPRSAVHAIPLPEAPG